jgi:hypothetical protein
MLVFDFASLPALARRLALLVWLIAATGLAPAFANGDAYSTQDLDRTVAIIRTLGKTTAHENDAVIDELKSHADAYPPPVFFSLSQLLYRRGDVDDAIFWFNAARLRADYDALRSADPAAAQSAVIAMIRQLPISLRKAQFTDLPKLRGIIGKVIAWDETTPHHYDARWIEFSGIAATNGNAARPAAMPPEKWDALAKQVRESYRSDLDKAIALISGARK